MEEPKRRNTTTEIRNIKMMKKYNEIVRSYGKLATAITKSTFYEELADIFDVSPKYAGAIIQKMLDKHGRRKKDFRGES